MQMIVCTLQRAGRVAKVRAHVKNRLADLKLRGTDSADYSSSHRKVADQKETNEGVQKSQGSDSVLCKETVKSSSNVLSELRNNLINGSKASQNSCDVHQQIVIRDYPESHVSPSGHEVSCKISQVQIEGHGDAECNLQFRLGSQDKPNILPPDVCVLDDNMDCTHGTCCENKPCSNSQQEYSQYTPIKRRVSGPCSGKCLSLQQGNQIKGRHGERLVSVQDSERLASVQDSERLVSVQDSERLVSVQDSERLVSVQDSNYAKSSSRSQLRVDNDASEGITSLSEQSEPQMSSQQYVPRMEYGHVVTGDEHYYRMCEVSQNAEPLAKVTSISKSIAPVSVSSLHAVTTQASKNKSGYVTERPFCIEVGSSPETMFNDVSKEPKTVESMTIDSQGLSESSQSTRKRRYRRADWSCVLPPRKSARLAASHTCAALDQSFLLAFSPESQLSECKYSPPVLLPRWHEGLSQVLLSQKRRRSKKLFPSLPQIVIEQHCFDANFVEFSLPVEDFKEFLPQFTNSSQLLEGHLTAQKCVSMGKDAISSQSVATDANREVLSILLQAVKDMNDSKTSFEEFSLPFEDFKDFLPQKPIPGSPTIFSNFPHNIHVLHTSEEQAAPVPQWEQEVKTVSGMSVSSQTFIEADSITNPSVFKTSHRDESIILSSQTPLETSPVTTKNLKSSFPTFNKPPVAQPLNQPRKAFQTCIETCQDNSLLSGSCSVPGKKDSVSDTTRNCTQALDDRDISILPLPGDLLRKQRCVNSEKGSEDYIETACVEGDVHQKQGETQATSTTNDFHIQNGNVRPYELEPCVQLVPVEVSANSSQPSVIQETQEMSDGASDDNKVDCDAQGEHHLNRQDNRCCNMNCVTVTPTKQRLSAVSSEIPNKDLPNKSQVNTNGWEMNTWDVKDSFKVSYSICKKI